MPEQELSVEETLVRLEEIVKSLDSEDISLENSMKLFEEGVRLADHLKKRLEESELVIKKVIEESEGFNFSDFDRS